MEVSQLSLIEHQEAMTHHDLFADPRAQPLRLGVILRIMDNNNINVRSVTRARRLSVEPHSSVAMRSIMNEMKIDSDSEDSDVDEED